MPEAPTDDGVVHAVGLPDWIQACLFDMDGVLTDTASVHAAAWKEMFDEFLGQRAEREGGPFEPFDLHRDYDEYVDGKPRADGVRDFLQSRHIELPAGDESDPPDASTVAGLGNRKNKLVLERIETQGVKVFPGSLRYLDAVRHAGLRCAVVSSSANTAKVLEVTGIAERFEVRVDGTTITERHLKGKPAPDSFLEAARQLGVAPFDAVVFEDALSGVAAGRAGHFGFVVGVDRVGQAAALADHGADLVVQDLDQLLAGDRSSK